MKYPNFWHKAIQCDNYQQINKELNKWCEVRSQLLAMKGLGFEHSELRNFDAIVPSVRPWLDSHNIGTIKNIALVVIGPKKDQAIHIDAQQMDLALNFGLCVAGTHTNMYRIVEGQYTTIPYGSQGLVYHSYDDCILEKETQFILDNNPVLFNTKQVHQVINPTDTPRVAVSLRFHSDPDHLL